MDGKTACSGFACSPVGISVLWDLQVSSSLTPVSVSSSAHSVISEEKGQCFRVLGSGLGPSSCSMPIVRNITKQICCCSRVGKAWGPECQRCPYFGSGLSEPSSGWKNSEIQEEEVLCKSSDLVLVSVFCLFQLPSRRSAPPGLGTITPPPLCGSVREQTLSQWAEAPR